MAPARSPAFALCRGLSVDFDSHGGEPQRIPSSSYTKSLFADLLSESYGASHIGDVASGIGLSDEKDCWEGVAGPECNYDDVFGGPPKLAALSSFRTRASFWMNRNGTWEDLINGASVCHPERSNVDVNISRPAMDTKVSPQMCFSDTDRKIQTKCEGKGVCGVDDLPTTPSSAPVAARKVTSAYFRRKTSPKLVRQAHARETPLKKVLKEGYGSYRPMKENVKASSNILMKECNGSGHGKRVYPEKEVVSQGSKGKESFGDGMLEGLMQHSKMKGERASGNKLWVTVKDVKLATDPCKFPAPSRVPPQPGSKFGSTETKPKTLTQVSNDQPRHSCLIEQSLSKSKLYKISSFEPCEEILDMDHVKLRLIDEATQQAKRRMAKKISDLERVQRNKELKGVKLVNKKSGKEEPDKEALKLFEGDQSCKHAEVSRSRFHTDKAKRVEMDEKARKARLFTEKESERLCERTAHNVHEKSISLDLREVKEHSKILGEAAGLERVTSPPYMDDLLGISSGEFVEILGETTRRRKARWERHCRTIKRMVKALEEKHERDLQIQQEQAERDRAGEILDGQIKHWAAGKEGNIRALLCSLQYVLWPECGWQPVSPSHLLTPGAVRQVYRKAALCLHPDKVQQRGASISQKYIAEKVFDLLKGASKKGNL